MSTAFATDSLVDVDAINALDFDIVLSCDHDQHDQLHVKEDLAWALIHIDVPCGDYGEYFICRSGWQRLQALTHAHCNPESGGCGGIHPRSDVNLRIIRVIAN